VWLLALATMVNRAGSMVLLGTVVYERFGGATMWLGIGVTGCVIAGGLIALSPWFRAHPAPDDTGV